MAITLNSTSNGSGSTSAQTSGSWSHNVAAGSDRVLLCCLAFDDATDHGTPAATYNSVAMTPIAELGNAGGSDRGLCLFGLIAPATGNNTLALSWTTGVAWAACSVCYDGVNQTTAWDWNSETNEAVGPSISQAVTSAVNDLIVGFVVVNAPTGTNPTATGTGHTNRALSTNTQIASRLSDLTGAATGTLTYDSDFEQYRIAGINLNVSAAALDPIRLVWRQ